jgi:hypothetical protein
MAILSASTVRQPRCVHCGSVIVLIQSVLHDGHWIHATGDSSTNCWNRSAQTYNRIAPEHPMTTIVWTVSWPS